jgi:hypothetical protein
MNSKTLDQHSIRAAATAKLTGGFTVWKKTASLYGFLSSCGQQWAVSIRPDRARRLLPQFFGVITLAVVLLLLAQDAAPRLFPARSHELLAATSLALIAFAYLIFQLANRAAPMELAKTILLAAAFLFWAANQFWPNLPEAGLFNDIAIALFVLDVFLVVVGWPPTSKEGLLAEAGQNRPGRCGMGCGCACCNRPAG